MCANTGLVHLQLVPDLALITLIKYLCRSYVCVLRKDIPQAVVSNNVKTFKANELKIFLGDNEIQWNFNLLSEPWLDGLFGSLIRSTKRYIRKCACNTRATCEEFIVILIEYRGC